MDGGEEEEGFWHSRESDSASVVFSSSFGCVCEWVAAVLCCDPGISGEEQIFTSY